ncbi:MAG TPA: hypothetical protein VF376_07265 [Thermoanaerobaculia bacterium]
MDPTDRPDAHLTEPELFTLALPPAGEPEALPRHLSECPRCSRAFSEWKAAVRELAEEEPEALRRRTPEQWDALADQTLEAVRRSRIGRRRVSVRWALAAAAVAAFFAVALPVWRGRSASERPAAKEATTTLSPQDQADDALLRDVARLTRSEDESSRLWSSLAPEPSSNEDDRL